MSGLARRCFRRGLGIGLAATVMAAVLETRAAEVTGEQVKAAIRAGVDYLRGRQREYGGWPEYGQYLGGTTSLALLALRNCGVPANDPAIVKGAEFLAALPNEMTYTVSLKAQALAAVDPVRYKAAIDGAVRWLIAAQNQEGGWTYSMSKARGDHSNSQFALLGLHEAARAGVAVPDAVWLRAEREWLASQHRDGGWGYVAQVGPTTGSMTAAGVASLLIVGNQVIAARERGYTPMGNAPDCGRYHQNRAMVRGVDWLTRNFSVESNPPLGNWYYYYLYGLERVGILLGLAYFGEHDWYREGAAALVERQRGDGSWREVHQLVDTSFALLFLGKGHRAMLIQKLRWSRNNDWQEDRNDIRNLIAFVGDRLGEPVTWQVTDLDAPLTDWLAAPILYFNGHSFPPFTAAQTAKLAEYVRQGGSILAEACCSRPEFRKGFEQFARTAFPDSPLRRLDPAHPIYHAQFEIDVKTEMLGIDVACRTSVVFLPRDVSCLWEQARLGKLSEQAFQAGTNIAAYFVGRQKLRDRLDAVHLVNLEEETGPVSSSALQMTQIMHSGDWRPDARSLPNLAAFLREQADVDVVAQAVPLRATDASLRDHPIAYLTGHFSFKLSESEIAALREYLRRGGFVFADACCGKPAFDASFRELAAELFPQNPLEVLPATHPILAGNPGFRVERVRYREAVRAEKPDLQRPVLEGITVDGRTVLVYSPYSLGCPIDGHACFACRGLETEDAKRLAANIILYALSY